MDIKQKKQLLALVILILVIPIAILVGSQTIEPFIRANPVVYVDGQLSADCPENTYSISARNCSGGDGRAFKSLNLAIASVAPGTVIQVRGGEYKEYRAYDESSGVAFYVNNPVYLKAYSGESATLVYDPASPPHFGQNLAPIVQIYTAGSVTIEGFTIRGTKNLSRPGEPLGEVNIDVSIGGELTIRNNKIIEAGHAGIKFGDMRGRVLIEHNEIANNGLTFYDHGIYSLAGDTNPKIIRFNNLHDNAGYGIHIYSADGRPRNHEVYANLVHNNNEGGIVITGSNHNVYRNTVYSQGKWGLRLFNYGLQNLDIRNNIFWNNNTDLDCETSQKVTGQFDNNIWKTVFIGETNPGDCNLVKNSLHSRQDPQFSSVAPRTLDDFRVSDSSPNGGSGTSLGGEYDKVLVAGTGWPAQVTESATTMGALAFGKVTLSTPTPAPTLRPGVSPTQAPTPTSTQAPRITNACPGGTDACGNERRGNLGQCTGSWEYPGNEEWNAWCLDTAGGVDAYCYQCSPATAPQPTEAPGPVDDGSSCKEYTPPGLLCDSLPDNYSAWSNAPEGCGCRTYSFSRKLMPDWTLSKDCQQPTKVERNPCYATPPYAYPSPPDQPVQLPRVRGDLDDDRDVDIFDYNKFLRSFGIAKEGATADFDQDGDVDIFDYNAFLNYLLLFKGR